MIRKKHRCSSIKQLKQIHSQIVIKGLISDPTSIKELLLSSIASTHGSIDYARKVFDQIPQPDLFSWNSMIRAAAHSSTPLHAISVYYSQMIERNVNPNAFTFIFLLKASMKLFSSFGFQLHATVTKLGLDRDVYVRNSLVNYHASCGDLYIARVLVDADDVVALSALVAGFAKRGQLDLARQVFNEMGRRDLIAWNVMISGYAKSGDMDNARKLFDHAPEKDVVSWNAMISGYVKCGSHKKAIEMHNEMVSYGESPDDATVLSLITSCAASGSLETGERIHQSMNELSLVHGNALIDMYAKCGSVENAMKVFDKMHERDIWTWNSITGGLAVHGRNEECINLFETMDVTPDAITFLNVLASCSHAGMVEKGRNIFARMVKKYEIEPNSKHYGCMVDMLGRAGFLKEALKLAEEKTVADNVVIWRTLLGACRIHGDVEMAKMVKARILEIGGDRSADYVMLSNVLSMKGVWDVAEVVRRGMDERGVKKEAGHAIVRDTS